MRTCRRHVAWTSRWLRAPWSASIGHPIVIGGLVLVTMVADYLTGPAIQFPILYLLPIGLAAWWSGIRLGSVLALTMPLLRIVFGTIRPEVWSGPELGVNAFIRIMICLIVVYFVNRTARQHRALQREVQQLSGILPICSFCKKIRSETNEWVALEIYIGERSEASFSHGLCEACFQKHYPDVYKGSPSATTDANVEKR